jgi:hypothetical protein
MLRTRFICARKSWHVDHRGDIAGQKTGLRLGKKGTPGAHVSAAIALLDRAYGKAPTFSTSDTQVFKRAIDMTDDELAAIVAKARLTVVK